MSVTMAKRCPKCDCPGYVMVEVPGVYDGGLFYECVNCHHRWHRFEPHHYLYTRAEPYVNGEKDAYV